MICSNAELSAVSDAIKSAKILGFDTETRPSFLKGEVHKVALLQLSTDSDAYLIRIHTVSDFEIIKETFENANIVKAGVAIRDDIKILQKVFKFQPQKFIELQSVAKEKGLTKFGLKGMTEEVLNGSISKAAKMTNWEARHLTDRQLLYAATDAWIGLKLYEKLMAQL